MRHRHRTREVITCPGVDVARLHAHDHRRQAARQHGPQRGHIDGAIPIRGHGLKRASAEAEQTQRAVDRGMALLTRHHGDNRASCKPIALHVPSDVREHLVASRGQAHRVGPLGAGHEPERHVTGKTQKLNEPGPGDLLDEGRRRRRQVVVRGWSQPTASTSAAVAASRARTR